MAKSSLYFSAMFLAAALIVPGAVMAGTPAQHLRTTMIAQSSKFDENARPEAHDKDHKDIRPDQSKKPAVQSGKDHKDIRPDQNKKPAVQIDKSKNYVKDNGDGTYTKVINGRKIRVDKNGRPIIK